LCHCASSGLFHFGPLFARTAQAPRPRPPGQNRSDRPMHWPRPNERSAAGPQRPPRFHKGGIASGAVQKIRIVARHCTASHDRSQHSSTAINRRAGERPRRRSQRLG
jgi:hypothetical protein